MPAVTLIALVLAGGLVALVDQATIVARPRGAEPRGAGEFSAEESMERAATVPGH
jgi:hypothetical protein